jgi:hypothetical protein
MYVFVVGFGSAIMVLLVVLGRDLQVRVDLWCTFRSVYLKGKSIVANSSF